MTKLEEMARAIYSRKMRILLGPELAKKPYWQWEGRHEAEREEWREIARAAVEALRETSEAMLAAAEPCMDDYGSYDSREELAKAHRAMIDAILSEGE